MYFHRDLPTFSMALLKQSFGIFHSKPCFEDTGFNRVFHDQIFFEIKFALSFQESSLENVVLNNTSFDFFVKVCVEIRRKGRFACLTSQEETVIPKAIYAGRTFCGEYYRLLNTKTPGLADIVYKASLEYEKGNPSVCTYELAGKTFVFNPKK